MMRQAAPNASASFIGALERLVVVRRRRRRIVVERQQPWRLQVVELIVIDRPEEKPPRRRSRRATTAESSTTEFSRDPPRGVVCVFPRISLSHSQRRSARCAAYSG